jgi:acetylornithine/succinyldiaminopimelate/putrescine aminotransferase
MEGHRMLSSTEKKTVLNRFARHISKAQVKLMRAAHLDYLETERKGASFRAAGSGRRVFDSFSSAGCFNVGRGNGEIIEAVCRAADVFDMGTPTLASPMKVEFARRLAKVSPGDLDHVIFTAAGGDAIDCALKLARGATGRNEILAMSKAYHGHSGFSLSANGKDYYRNLFEPLMPGFTFLPFGDLEAARRAAGENTAAIILEPIQGEGGIHVGDDYYLRGLRELCDSLGIVLIFDEIQTGFARTGRMFYSEHSGVCRTSWCSQNRSAAGSTPYQPWCTATSPC